MNGLLPPKDPMELASWVLTPTGMVVAIILLTLLVAVEIYLTYNRGRTTKSRQVELGRPTTLGAAD